VQPPDALGDEWLLDLVEVGMTNRILTEGDDRPNPIDALLNSGAPVIDCWT
jgi:hypothetical protein